jgi:predicted DCC family thiol-disulfide oxidoreductase YuxK
MTNSHDLYPLEFLYDGQCAICRFDVAHLRRRDTENHIHFIDISATNFDPAPYGRSRDELLARITARRADGLIVEGPEVFRLAWSAIGFRKLAALTRLPVVAPLAELAYRVFARHRVALSRRFGGIFARLTPPCENGDACQISQRKTS